MHALVVEDETLIRMLVCDLLEDTGVECTGAASAEEALALLDGALCRPDLLVTDYNLGPGLDGVALAQEVRLRLPGIGIAYVTGNPKCCAGSHVPGPREAIVPKPFAPDDLVAAVKALAGAEPRTAAPARRGAIGQGRPMLVVGLEGPTPPSCPAHPTAALRREPVQR